jgi:hypothetical protein
VPSDGDRPRVALGLGDAGRGERGGGLVAQMLSAPFAATVLRAPPNPTTLGVKQKRHCNQIVQGDGTLASASFGA